jgi:hypothetical protein
MISKLLKVFSKAPVTSGEGVQVFVERRKRTQNIPWERRKAKVIGG